MTRERVVRAVLWTIICVGLLLFVAIVQALGDCGYPVEACLAAKERTRQVILVATPLIWLFGLMFFLRPRKR